MRRNGAILLKTIRELRARGEAGGPPVVAGWMTRTTVAQVVQAPAGKYRWFVSQIRRARRGDLTVKVPNRRRVVRDRQDVRWSETVRTNFNWTCQRCHRSFFEEDVRDYLEAAHIVPRRYRKVRTLLENGIALCTSCHQHMTDHPDEFKAWVIETIGQAEYDRLWMLARA